MKRRDCIERRSPNWKYLELKQAIDNPVRGHQRIQFRIRKKLLD
nr:hypothetical protein [Bacillus velezensis]